MGVLDRNRVYVAEIGGSMKLRLATSVGGVVLDNRATWEFDGMDDLVDTIATRAPDDVAGVAISTAGTVVRNEIRESPNLKQAVGYPLAAKLSERIGGRPVAIGNDMTDATLGMAKLLAQSKYPRHRAIERFLGITLGSGVGAKRYAYDFVEDGAEMGHESIDNGPFSGWFCGCGKSGDAESMLGGAQGRFYILAAAHAAKMDIPPDIDPWTALDNDYRNGESWAIEYYRRYAEILGAFLADARTFMPFEAVVFKGSIAEHAFKWIRLGVRASMKRHLGMCKYWADRTHLQLIMSPDPKSDALIGAAARFRDPSLVR